MTTSFRGRLPTRLLEVEFTGIAVLVALADYGYWQTISDERALTARIALFDEDEDNGCMQVLPGSHAWPQVFVAGAHPMQSLNVLLCTPTLRYQSESVLVHWSRSCRSKCLQSSQPPNPAAIQTDFRACRRASHSDATTGCKSRRRHFSQFSHCPRILA